MRVTGDTDGLIGALRRTVELEPDHLRALQGLVSVYLREDRFDEALQVARRIQERFPEQPMGFGLEGDVHLKAGREEAALAAYQRALDLESGGVAVARVAVVQRRAGNREEAEHSLREWLQDNPADVFVRERLAGYYLQDGDPGAAMEEYKTILEEDRNHLTALNNLANLLKEKGETRDAMDFAKRAFELNPNVPAVVDTYAELLMDNGFGQRAARLLERAVSQAPNNPTIRYQWAKALYENGDPARARQQLEQLLEGGEDFPERDSAQRLYDRI